MEALLQVKAVHMQYTITWYAVHDLPPFHTPTAQDEDRLALAENNAPTWEELNAALARCGVM